MKFLAWWWPFHATVKLATTPYTVHFSAPALLADSSACHCSCSTLEQRPAHSVQELSVWWLPQLPYGGNPSAIPGPDSVRAATWRSITNDWRCVGRWTALPGEPQLFQVPDTVRYGALQVKARNEAGQSCDGNLVPSKVP